MHQMDSLYAAVAAKGPVCVGLDTAPEYVPENSRRRASSDAAAVGRFNAALVDATIDVCACYKVQIAYYEALGLAGLSVYADTLRYIKSKGALAIADIKRGDIADTAARYAQAHFDGDFAADFVTLSPYMGIDSLDPWLERIKTGDKGAFVLLRTSNVGMRDFQYLNLGDGRHLYNAVGDKLRELADKYPGERGYGAVGAVVGCTEAEEAAALRLRYANMFFLIPGYGAQGGAAEDAARLLRGGNGGIVNASRSILKAWKLVANAAQGDRATHMAEKTAPRQDADLDQAAAAGRAAAIAMRDAILAAGSACP